MFLLKLLGLTPKPHIGQPEEDIHRENWKQTENQGTGDIVKRATISLENDFLNPEETFSQGVGNFRNRAVHETLPELRIPGKSAKHPYPSNADHDKYRNEIHNSMHGRDSKIRDFFSSR
jgi:hypothetical protein